MNLYPHIKSSLNKTQLVMLDVVIALLPTFFIGCLILGWIVPKQIGIALLTAFITEFLFSALILKKYKTIFDGSAIVTSFLLVFTLAPLTPWYVVVFGTFSAILFGKIVWGGLGKNRFNPALVGREFMSVFFAVQMVSPTLWQTDFLIQQKAVNLFSGFSSSYFGNYLSIMIYKTNGAMGEYSVLAIVLGGLYLLSRNRISWHIPFSLLITFTLMTLINNTETLQYSIAGILFGTIFMATDMPSSPTTEKGKIYYGTMMAVCIFIFIKAGIRFEYLSYSILLMNGFSDNISQTFKPTSWGESVDWKKSVESVFLLTLKILAIAVSVLTVHYNGMIKYVIYLFIIYIIFKFNFSFTKTINKYV